VEDKLFVLDQYEAISQSVMTSKKEQQMLWAEIAVSVDGKAVALVDRGGYLWGGTPDFKITTGVPRTFLCLLWKNSSL
jgi:hypothetical protein